ncbi:MAG: hypothetical protein ACI4BC_06465 [Muribaculaceae bacterium]
MQGYGQARHLVAFSTLHSAAKQSATPPITGRNGGAWVARREPDGSEHSEHSEHSEWLADARLGCNDELRVERCHKDSGQWLREFAFCYNFRYLTSL